MKSKQIIFILIVFIIILSIPIDFVSGRAPEQKVNPAQEAINTHSKEAKTFNLKQPIEVKLNGQKVVLSGRVTITNGGVSYAESMKVNNKEFKNVNNIKVEKGKLTFDRSYSIHIKLGKEFLLRKLPK